MFCVFYIFGKHKILQVILQARFSFAYFDTLQTISTRNLGQPNCEMIRKVPEACTLSIQRVKKNYDVKLAQ